MNRCNIITINNRVMYMYDMMILMILMYGWIE